jgi:hypothetical protein
MSQIVELSQDTTLVQKLSCITAAAYKPALAHEETLGLGLFIDL